MAIIAAIALPAVLMVGVGAIDLAFVWRDKTASQAIADAAALMGAKEMSLSPSGAGDRAKAYALAASKDLQTRAEVDVTVTAPTDNSLTVVVHTHRQSFFGNILPPGGFHTYARATAASLRQAPLCVIATRNSGSDVLELDDNSKMTASCLVHSDRDIRVSSGAALTGKVVEAVTSSSGVTTPTALTGVKNVGDPFTAIDVDFPAPCLGPVGRQVNIDTTLAAGLHCFNYDVKNGVTLTLAPGIHYFGGDLSLKNKASLIGSSGGVTLVFGPGARLDSKNGANISLIGSQSGKLAGFVMATTRDYNAEFKINSDPISKITGAIYVPSGGFTIDGSKNAAGSSDWTVIAARTLKLEGKPNLIINANYASSPVPVPSGVGPAAGARLSY